MRISKNFQLPEKTAGMGHPIEQPSVCLIKRSLAKELILSQFFSIAFYIEVFILFWCIYVLGCTQLF